MKQGELVEKAFNFAIKSHKGQYRKSFPLPYATHVIEVYKQVFNYGVRDEEVLAAALLHDYIEDVNPETGYVVLKKKFGINVANYVQECSRVGGDHVGNNHKLEFMKSFEKKSFQSVVIKIADRACNVRDYLYAGRDVYAAWYALQAYPLLDRYYDSINGKAEVNIQHIDADIIFLTQLIQKHYTDRFDQPKIDKILMKRPRG